MRHFAFLLVACPKQKASRLRKFGLAAESPLPQSASSSIIVLLPLLLLFCASTSFGYSDPNLRVISPNERYTVQASEDFRHYRIIGNSKNKIDETIVMYSLPLSLKWTGDSKTIVSIEHRAGGSVMVLITKRDLGWKSFEVTVPNNAGHFSVISQSIGWSKIKVMYKATRERPNGLLLSYYTCSFTVNPDTDTFSHIIVHDISMKAFSNLKAME